MLGKIFLGVLLVMGAFIGWQYVPKNIAKESSIFLIIMSIVLFVLALMIFGFKAEEGKRWWWER